MTEIAGTTIRAGCESDLGALVKIYNHYVLETPTTFDVEPYTIDGRRPWFNEFSESGRYRLFVAESAGELIGYSHSNRFRPKASYETSVETTVYLKPGIQGRGVGTLLYTALRDALEHEDVHRAYGGVAQPNQASNALHRKMGFREVAHFREVGRKFGRYHDVVWFEFAF